MAKAMIMRLPVIIQFSFKCGICMQVQVGDVQECPLKSMMYDPTLPQGWKLYEGMTICPKHEIEVKIDGKTVNFPGDRY